MFTNKTKSIVWGMQTRAVQSMLDFDFVCSRSEPSVVAIIYPFTGDHKQKYYWGHKEILIPGEYTDRSGESPALTPLFQFTRK
jgi:ATP citrate (pro-S)-lyase